MRTLKYIFAIAVVLGFLGYVCFDIFFPNGFGGDDEENPATTKKTALNIGAPNNISSLPIWVAEEDSIFDSLRVDISVREFTDQLDCDMAFAEGKINLSISDPKRAEWLATQKKQNFTELRKFPMPYAMVACHKARIANITQLKDKMLAVTRHSSYSAAAFACLDSVKMKHDSVYIVQINNPVVATHMLHNAELDATFLPEPFVSLAKTMGHNALYKNYAQALLIAKNDIKADDKKRLNQAIDEAVKRIRKNGIKHYSELIARRCKCSQQFDNELKVRF